MEPIKKKKYDPQKWDYVCSHPSTLLIVSLCSIFLAFVTVDKALAANYYVATTGNDSTGDGSIGKPWRTINKGQSSLDPGDTLLIRGGRYYESVTITRSGTPGNPITIKAYQDMDGRRETVILDGTAAVTGWIQCTNSDAFLTVQGVVNPNYASVYKLDIHEDDLPAATEDFMLYEDGTHCRIARQPDQLLGYGYDLSLFTAITAEGYGQTGYLLDLDELTQASDYWNGAWIDVYSRGANGWVIRRTIDDFYDAKIYFDVPLVAALMVGDSYSIVNHPHVLDSAGEFAHTMTPDGNGDYTFYLWPISTDNLSSGITIPTKNFGIIGSNKSYIVIEDLAFAGYSQNGVLMEASSGQTIDSITVSGCTVEDCGATGIYLIRVNDGTIEDCVVNRVGNRGVFINQGTNGLIQNCTVIGASSTSASFYMMDGGRIINNILHDTVGSHGNGISCYINCKDILIAYNYLPQANIALQDIKNVVVFANVVDYEELSTSIMNTWGDSDGRTNGLQVYINNTFLGDPTDSALDLKSQDEEPYPLNYVINNIVDGCNSWDAFKVPDMSYNLYTGYGYRQSSKYGWSLQEGELDGRNYTLQQIFTSPGTDADEDYTLAANSPAIGAGKSVVALLETLGITGDTPWFPGFDFTKDKAGNPWVATPSMGAYEYVAGGDPNTPTYTITATVGSNGQISPNGSAQISSGGSQIYTITPDTGYQVADVLVDNSSVGAVSSYSFTNVTSDHTISASFIAVDTYAITASAGSGGQISPNGSAQIISGGSQIYTITPDAGHQVADVLVDNSSVGAVSSYSFANVTSDHTISASFAVADLNTGLVGRWEFEEGTGLTTEDSSGNDNAGNLANDQMWTGGGELNFDGDNDYVNCGTNSSLNITNSLTICARISPRTYGENGWGRIVDKGNGSTGFSFFLNQADSNLGYVIYGGTVVRSDSAVIALNQQQHVSVVYSSLSSTITFFVDGQPAGSSNYQTNPIDSSNDPLFIGIRGYDLNRDFDGLIDEVRVYNRALSADEIQEIYNAGTSGNNPPVAEDDVAIVNEDSEDNVINVLANDTDADGDTPTITSTSVTQSTHGTVAITGGGTGLTYTPTPDYNGLGSFTYTISDGQGGIDTATVSVTVTNVPDPPVLESIGDKTINENQMLTITVNATDADGDTIEYSAQQLPPGATFASPLFEWTPTYDDEGTYEVIFIASDGSLSDSETITITVNNVNRPPVAANDSAVTDEDNAVTTGNVLINDTDADGSILGIDGTTQPTHGTVIYNSDGTFTYTPAANYNGSDSFTYTVSDYSGGTDTATVHIDITPINDSPDISAIPDTLQKYEGESILPAEIELATDVDGDVLTYTYLPDLQATDYILHVNVSDGTVTVGKNVTITVIPVLPTVVSATATKFGVEVSFSEEVGQTSAENITNYTLNNDILINAANLNTEPDKVTLYTTAHAKNTVYTLTVSGVEDLAGNSISEVPIDYTYDSGLIGLWNFNTDGGNTALDMSGLDNTATLVNGPVWTEQGNLTFDGIDDEVEIPTNYWNVNSGTVALWAYAVDLSGTRYLFGHTTGAGNDKIQLYTLDQNLNLALGNSDELNIENLDSQTWHHIALTWNGIEYFVYVDGTEKASGFYTGLNNLSEFAGIGNSGDVSFDNAFAGHIDDVRVYERALTPDEIVNVYLMSDESIRESKTLAFDVSATYPDGSVLIYSDSDPNLLLDDTLDGASFENGTFTWNPWYDQAGTYDITFLPGDQQQPQYSQAMTIVVQDVELSSWYQRWLVHLGLL